jgi:transposase
MIKKYPTERVIFKPYQQHQICLLPESLEDIIPKSHLVRVVNSAIESMDIKPLIEEYKGGGTSSYHPKMLLKVIVYAYTQKVYSCRMIAKRLREDINFMWLSGKSYPDFRTINRFRSSRLKQTIEEVFKALVELLIREGYIDLENYFLDGTKIEANANRYTYVWAKKVKREKEKIHEKVKEILNKIDEINLEENTRYGDKDLEEMGEEVKGDITEKIKQTAEKINKRLEEISEKKQKAESKQEKEAIKKQEKEIKGHKRDLERNYLPRYIKYAELEKLLGDRGSLSKTDPDATFMRMKDDHLRNSQLKPSYNVQLGTENQMIIFYSIHQKPGDTIYLKPHIEKLEEIVPRLPQNITADAGYGSLENYEYLERKEMKAYVKYNTFYREQKKKEDEYAISKFERDEEKGELICPEGKALKYLESEKRETENGYEYEVEKYDCCECKDCAMRNICVTKGKESISYNHRLIEHRKRAKELLESDVGIQKRKQRNTEVETVFGQIKQNMGFRRFLLRGLKKVSIEIGLISIAHNIKKKYNRITEKTEEQALKIAATNRGILFSREILFSF